MKRAPKLQPVFGKIEELPAELKEHGIVDALGSLFAEDNIRAPESVGSRKRLSVAVPHDEVDIVTVVVIQIAGGAGALRRRHGK